MHHGGPNAIQPTPAIGSTWSGEGSTAELLRVQTERRLLRSILALGQSPSDRLGRKLVGKSCLIRQIRHDFPRLAILGRESTSRFRKENCSSLGYAWGDKLNAAAFVV